MISESDIKEKAIYIMQELPGKGIYSDKPWITFYENLYGPTVVLHDLDIRYELSVCLNHLYGVYVKQVDGSEYNIDDSLISARVQVYSTKDQLVDQGDTPTYTQEDIEYNFWISMYNWIQQNWTN